MSNATNNSKSNSNTLASTTFPVAVIAYKLSIDRRAGHATEHTGMRTTATTTQASTYKYTHARIKLTTTISMTAAAPCAIRSFLRNAEGSEIDTSQAICLAYKVCN